jgi:hypothetical protein
MDPACTSTFGVVTRFITIDNPKANLSQQYDISSQSHEFPWEYLRDLLRMPDERTSAILDLIKIIF